MLLGLALLLGAPVLPGAVAAQTAQILPAAAVPPLTSCSVSIVPTRECFRRSDLLLHNQHASAKAPDHRYEGLAIGAIAGGVGGLLLGLAVCGQSDDPDTNTTACAIGGGLGGAVLGGFVGLLVGGLFPKEEATPKDSVPN
jgi:uncharacterized protein YcfJ